jgi:hypothetical protein
MPKQKIDDVKKEIEKEKDDVYGDESVGGSQMGLDKDDDTTEMVEDVTGNKPTEGKPYSIADEPDNFDEADDSEE